MSDAGIETRRQRVCPCCSEQIMRVAYARRKKDRADDKGVKGLKRAPLAWYRIGWFCPDPVCHHFIPRLVVPDEDDPETEEVQDED